MPARDRHAAAAGRPRMPRAPPAPRLRRIKQTAPAVPVQTRIASDMRCNFA